MHPVIVASELVCPVGLAAGPACAAMRAGIKVFEESELLGLDRSAIVTSAISRIPKTRSIRARLRWMLPRALGPLVDAALLDRVGAAAVPIFVAFVERPRRGADETLARGIFEQAQAMLGSRCAPSLSRLHFGGAPAGFRALESAQKLLESGEASACIVLALDSWLDARSLLWLSERAPLQTARGPGLTPGEAGAALLLTAPGALPHVEPQARLLGLGSAVERSAQDPSVPLRGDGLREAVVGALGEGGELGETDLRMSDDAGTHAGAKEQMLLLARLLKAPIADLPLWLPAESLGHVGAAAGLAQIVWAIQARARAYLPGPRVLCTTSNFSGERGTALIEVLGQPRSGALGARWS